MKIIITESQYEMLFKELSPALKRRLSLKDFEYFDKHLSHQLKYSFHSDNFNDFSRNVIGDLLHDFVTEVKGDEIETYNDPEDGEMWVEESTNKILNLYWPLLPILEKKYKDRLYQYWEKIKQLK